MNKKDITQNMPEDYITDLMYESDIPEFIIYAYMKTGRIVTPNNQHLLSQADLEEWNNAIDEFMLADGASIH